MQWRLINKIDPVGLSTPISITKLYIQLKDHTIRKANTLNADPQYLKCLVEEAIHEMPTPQNKRTTSTQIFTRYVENEYLEIVRKTKSGLKLLFEVKPLKI